MALPRNILGVPLHPLLVPFPLVLWLTSPILACAALAIGPEPWWSLSLLVTTLGVIVGVASIATGLAEFVRRSSVDTDVRLSASHGIRAALAWLLFTIKLLLAAVLASGTVTISIALGIDLIACVLLVQSVIYGTRLIYSDEFRERGH